MPPIRNKDTVAGAEDWSDGNGDDIHMLLVWERNDCK